MPDKVYCSDCLNFKSAEGSCIHCSNLQMVDSWDCKREICTNFPEKLNRHNDCPNYNPRSKMLKMYCSDCVYGEVKEDQCNHPDNIEEVADWSSTYRENILDCSTKNADNNCSYFKPKSHEDLDNERSRWYNDH